MKAKYAIALSILALAGLTSCEKNLYDENQNPDGDKKVTDLVIPTGFDWKMIENGKCHVTSPRAVKVNIYADKSLKEGSLLATTAIKAGGEINLPISLVRGSQEVYIQYEDATGAKNTETASIDGDGNINFTIKSAPRTRDLTDDDFIKENSTLLYYPSKDFGTVMFEDNYPSLGDYDFNDFVADYQFIIETDPIKTDKINKVTFIMEVKAIGANQSLQYYIPHFGLSIPKECIDEIKASTRDYTTGSVEVINVSDKTPKNNYVMFAIIGAELNAKKDPGSIYLNTEAGYITDTKTIVVDVTFKEAGLMTADMNFIKADGFDIFLVNKEYTKEIHMNGFTPVLYSSSSTTEYISADGFVWGINIPVAVGHTTERTDILKAYPDFEKWIKSPELKWYDNPDKKFLFSWN